MIITREYGYRTDYSKVEVKVGQSLVIEDNLPTKIIHGENMLLGCRVRLLVLLEVLSAGLFENEETAIREFENITFMLQKSARAIGDICKVTDTNPQPYVYSRLEEFKTELKYISNTIKETIYTISNEGNGSTENITQPNTVRAV